MEDFERKVAVSEMWKNYLGLIALIIGGFWAVYTFHALKSSYSAHLDIESKEASRLLLDFDIKVTELNCDSENLIGLEMEVCITNHGTLPAKIELSKSNSSFNVVKLQPGVDVDQNPNIGELYTAESFSFYNGKAWGVNSGVVALPKVTTSIKYFVQVKDPGYYFVSFSAPVSLDAQQTIEKREIGSNPSSIASHIWNAQKYFSVLGKKSNKANSADAKSRAAD